NTDIPLPTEYKRELLEEKKKQIIEYIRRVAMDAKTKMPLTYERAKELLEMSKYNVNLNDPIEKQAMEAIEKIRKFYPLKIEYKNIRIIVPPEKYKIIGIIKNKYKVIKEDWSENYVAIVEVPIGLLSEFYSDIGKLCGDLCTIEELK
ncbi:MAG: hypothetical protein ACP5G1_02120, partial [Nanopusillaceae archaeon]